MQESAIEWFESQLFIPDAFACKGSIWPLRIGRNVTKPNYRTGLKILEYYNVHFIMEGKVEFDYGGEQVVLSKGDAFGMFPGDTYRYSLAPGHHELQMTWVSMDGPHVPGLFERAGLSRQKPFLRGVLHKELESALRLLFHPRKYDLKRHLELCAILYQMFALLVPQDEAERTRQGIDSWIARSVAYMDTHYAEKITVHDVADYLSLHRAYFSKLFTERMGISPIRYLQQLRMDKAADLLSAGYAIVEIAAMLGYSDAYAFTHAFSKFYGMPPGHWRRARRGGAAADLGTEATD